MSLSAPQQQIVSLVNEGVTSVGEIAQRLGKSEGIVRAQITRIRTAGEGHQVANVKDATTTPVRDKPRSTGPTSNQAVTKEAAQDPAAYEVPEALAKEFQQQFGDPTDIHPMVLLGVTIQYVKLVGGRLSAHQCIEQVYSALQTMVGDGSPKVGQEEWSAPWPLNSVEAENEVLKQRITELESKVAGSDLPAHEPAPSTGQV